MLDPSAGKTDIPETQIVFDFYHPVSNKYEEKNQRLEQYDAKFRLHVLVSFSSVQWNLVNLVTSYKIPTVLKVRKF